MSCCFGIKIRNRPNYLKCDRYSIRSSQGGDGLTVEYTKCGGGSKDTFFMEDEENREICVQVGTQPIKKSGSSNINELTYLGPCTTEDPDALEDIWLDLFPNTELRETKQLTELTEVDTLRFNYSLGIDIPNTDNNFNALKTLFNPNVLDNEYNEINVEVYTGSHVITESELYVKKCTKDVISIELRLSTDHWARKAKDIKLCELPYETVTMNCDHIRDVVENQWPYDSTNNDFTDENNLGIWYPAVNYGRMIQDPTVPNTNGRSNNWIIPLELWRPWYYVTGILKRGFCRLGWVLESPLFESEFGRKLITYITNKSYGLEGERKDSLKVRAEVDTNYALGFTYLGGKVGTVRFPNVIYDPLGSLDVPTGIYSASGEVNVRGKIIFEPGEDDVEIELIVGKIVETSGPSSSGGSFFGMYSLYESRTFDSISDEQEWEFEIENVSVASIEKLAVVLKKNPQSTFVFIKQGSYLEIEGVRSYFVEDEEESLRSLIDCSYTFMDFLKGLSHLFNLKFKTDFANRTVGIYHPYDADFWGDPIEGFYIEETIEDISAKIDEKSKIVETPAIETPRYQKLAFKDSKDKYIDQLELADPLWSKTVDLGEKFTLEETNESKNPFFEPTANRNGIFTNSFAIHTPVMRGENEYSWNFGPRIAIAHGNVIQDFDSISSPKLKYCKYDDETSELIPTASQHTPIKLGEIHNDENSPASIPEENLIYEVNPEIDQYDVLKSLYHLVYKRWMLEQLNNLKIQYLVDLTTKEYLETDFRKYYCFYHLGRLVTARIQRVSDYHYCSNILTPIDFVPQRQLSDLCNLLPDNNGEGGDDNTPFTCRNTPVLLCSNNINGCYTITLGGANNAPINNVLFEYRIEGSNTWNTLTNITQTSTQICDLVEDFYIRATVFYDIIEDVQCDPITLPEKLIKPCPDLDLEIECVSLLVVVGRPGSPGIPALRARIKLPDEGYGITIINSEVNPNNEGWENYPIEQDGLSLWGDILIGSGQVFDFTITFQINNCSPITLTKTCDIPGGIPNPDCDIISMELNCVEVNPGCFVFERNGILPFEYDDYIKYRCSDDGIDWGPWKLWDGETEICCSFIEGRWFANFCDGVCPFSCSPIVSCGGCTPFQVDTINQIALCNNGNYEY